MAIRRELSLLSEGIRTTKKSKKLQMEIGDIDRKYSISNATTREVIIEKLKQKILAFAQRIKRYKKRGDFRVQNRLFETNPKKFYRVICHKESVAAQSPTMDEAESFWSRIWEEQKMFHENSAWLVAECEAMSNIPQQPDDQTEITLDELKSAIKRMANWKSPGIDKIQAFWIKKLTSIHPHMARAVNCLVSGNAVYPKWLTRGMTYLLPKGGDRSLVKNYRPITCLPVMYKIITAAISGKMYNHLQQHDLLPIEQKGCRKGSYGCKELLLLNKIILKNAKQHRRNLSVAWIDYKKAYDSVPHDWLLRALETYKFHPTLIGFCKRSMEQWCTTLYLQSDRQRLESRIIKIKNGIFQGDSLSPLLFCISLIPLSRLLTRPTFGYKLHDNRKVVSHLLYMDDLKLFARSEKALNEMLTVVKEFSDDIQMQLGPEKCAKVHIKRGKREQSENILLDRETVIRDLEPGQTYRYLGMEEDSEIVKETMKRTISKEYFRRVRLVLRTELNSKNKISAISSLAVPVVEYSFGLIDWTQQEILSMDRKTRKLLTLHGALHPRADVDRIYVTRREGGRGLRQLETAHKNAILKMGQFVVQQAGDMLMRQVLRDEEKNGNRGVVSQAQKIAAKMGHATTDGDSILSFNIKRVSQERLKDSWKGKRLHGQFLHRVENSNISKDHSHMWLKRGKMKPETEALITAAQDQALRTHHYEKCILKTTQDDRCRLCRSQSETLDHIVSGCSVLAKHEYSERHNRVCSYLHWQICKALDVPDLRREWYKHTPKPVTTVGYNSILYDQQIHTDRTITANKPDIVVHDKAKKQCLLIDVSVPNDGNVTVKQAEKKLKYKSLAIEIGRMWNVKTEIVPIIVGALGLVPSDLRRNLSKLPGSSKDYIIQDIVLYGTAHILRKVL